MLFNNVIPYTLKVSTLLIAAFLAAACQQFSTPSELTSAVQSPIPEDETLFPVFQDPLLTENRWRLVSLVIDDDSLQYPDIAPVYISFHPEDILGYSTTNCNGGGFHATPMPNNKFQLAYGVTSSMQCSEVAEVQSDSLLAGLVNLTTVEVTKDRVLLTGHGVTAELVIHKWETGPDATPIPAYPAPPTPIVGAESDTFIHRGQGFYPGAPFFQITYSSTVWIEEWEYMDLFCEFCPLLKHQEIPGCHLRLREISHGESWVEDITLAGLDWSITMAGRRENPNYRRYGTMMDGNSFHFGLDIPQHMDEENATQCREAGEAVLSTLQLAVE